MITKSAPSNAAKSFSLGVEDFFVTGTPQDLAIDTTDSMIGVPRYALTPVEVISSSGKLRSSTACANGERA